MAGGVISTPPVRFVWRITNEYAGRGVGVELTLPPLADQVCLTVEARVAARADPRGPCNARGAMNLKE